MHPSGVVDIENIDDMTVQYLPLGCLKPTTSVLSRPAMGTKQALLQRTIRQAVGPNYRIGFDTSPPPPH